MGETVDRYINNEEQYKTMIDSLEQWENGLTELRWREAKNWNQVTFEIYKSLMENRENVIFDPKDLGEIDK